MMIKSKILLRYLLFFLVNISYIMFLLIAIDWELITEGYKITAALPFCYIFCFFLLLWKPVINKKSPFVVLFSFIAFIRYFVLSILILSNGGYEGISGLEPSKNSLILAAVLMIYELVIVSIFINIWSNKYIPEPLPLKSIRTQKQYYVYLAFILITIITIIIIPEAHQGLSFLGNININVEDNEAISNIFILGVRECFINAKYFLLFVFIMIFASKKGQLKVDISFAKYLGLLLLSFIIIGLRIGINRKKLLADTLAISLLLGTLFPKYKRMTYFSLIVVGVILVAYTTLYRGMIESYGDFFDSFFDVKFFQAYFLGQYNVAIAIESINFYSHYLNFKSLLYDSFRSIFGIGSLIKSINILVASDLFINRMSIGLSSVTKSQIIPLIGQGYMYLGFLFAPLFSLIFCRIGIFCDKLYKNTQQLEIAFLSCYVSFYLGQFMILNMNIILKNTSFLLAIFIPVFLLSKFFDGLWVNNKKIR